MKHTHLCAAAAAAALVLGGCVTQGTYEELQAQKNQEVAALESERAALETQRAGLAQQVRILQEQRAALESEKVAIEGQQAELLKQVNVLEVQKSKLMSASQQSQQQYDAVVANLSDQVQKGQLQVRRYKDMLTVDVAEQLFFDSGRAALKDSGKKVLQEVADALKDYADKAIRVVGHTDNVPIAKTARSVFASNWELSAARATTVVRFLQEGGIAPERLIATGRAEYAPVAPNDSVEGRQKNRRIEITLIDPNLLQEAR
ncbi:MAG: OmpA family protein [Burkholderiales bacterium]